MQILQGIDIVSVLRIQRAIESQGNAFLNRVFTAREQAYCQPRRMKYEHYAARFAAKEAFIKAVKASRRTALSLTDIEVRRKATGKPFISLLPASRKKLSLSSSTRIELSMAHEREYAIATVVIVMPEKKEVRKSKK